MAKSKSSDAKLRLNITKEELEEFNKLLKGHEKFIRAVGRL